MPRKQWTQKDTEKYRIWYQANYEKRKAYEKEYRRKNKERIALAKKKWREDNRELFNKQSREYLFKRRREDAVFRKKRNAEAVERFHKSKELITKARYRRMATKEGRQKDIARKIVFNEIRSGRLKRPTNCPRCRIKCKVQAHHSDYSKPLAIQWLCALCHGAEHHLIGDKIHR